MSASSSDGPCDASELKYETQKIHGPCFCLSRAGQAAEQACTQRKRKMVQPLLLLNAENLNPSLLKYFSISAFYVQVM